MSNDSNVVNADKLVAKIATWISTNNGARQVPADEMKKMVQECSHSPSSVAASSIHNAIPPQKITPNWYCRPFFADSAYQRQRQNKMRTIRERLRELTNGNLTVAIDICRNLEANLRYTIRSDKFLIAALALTTPETVPSTAAMDCAIVENVKEFLAHETHKSSGPRKDGIQHMVDTVLCAVSSSKDNLNKVSCRKLADRLGIVSHHVLVKAVNNREEVMQSQGMHKFCQPKKRQKRCDAGMKKGSVSSKEPASVLNDERVCHRLEEESEAMAKEQATEEQRR